MSTREDREKKIQRYFQDHVSPLLELPPDEQPYVVVGLDGEEQGWIEENSGRIATRKTMGGRGDAHYLSDDRRLYTRFSSGIAGEFAFVKHLGLDPREYVDVELGSSHDMNVPDFSYLNLKLGSKSAHWSNLPMVFSDPKWAELISIRCTYKCLDMDSVYLFGIASVDVQREYSDLELVKDERAYERGTKKGFYGFRYLDPITDTSLDELRSRYPI